MPLIYINKVRIINHVEGNVRSGAKAMPGPRSRMAGTRKTSAAFLGLKVRLIHLTCSKSFFFSCEKVSLLRPRYNGLSIVRHKRKRKNIMKSHLK